MQKHEPSSTKVTFRITASGPRGDVFIEKLADGLRAAVAQAMEEADKDVSATTPATEKSPRP